VPGPRIATSSEDLVLDPTTLRDRV